MSVAVIIAASGSGTRFGGVWPKQFQMMGGRPIIAHTLEVFDRVDVIDNIVVAVPEGYVDYAMDIADGFGCKKVENVLAGGANRAVSVYEALKQLPSCTEIVLVHDGVRPFVSDALIRAVIESARAHGAAVAGTSLTDTLKEVDGTGKVVSTPDRSRFWQVQTPQGFTYDTIMKAYEQGERDGILGQATDDSFLVERLGVSVKMVEGHPGNIKITTPEDLLMGEAMLRQAP